MKEQVTVWKQRQKEKEKGPLWVKIVTLICIAGLTAAVVYGFQTGIFTDRASLEAFVGQAGLAGPILFILIQILQVVVPVIPGGVSCVAGVILFGPWYGLLYNYLGVVAGSCINFYLARRYGQCFVKYFVKEETYNKYAAWLEKGRKFDKFFAFAILVPCAPDDLLCLLAGLTKMSWKRFSAIIFFGKPASVAMYSVAFVWAGSWFTALA